MLRVTVVCFVKLKIYNTHYSLFLEGSESGSMAVPLSSLLLTLFSKIKKNNMLNDAFHHLSKEIHATML